MANNVLLNEITEFKNLVASGGMLIINYIEQSKQIKNKIDIESEKCMRFFRCLLYLDKISMDQYLDVKSKVDESRVYYKRLLYYI